MQTNLSYGLPAVSQSGVSRIKKELFNNVAIKPVGSSFAKCTVCDQLQQFIGKSVKGSAEYVGFVKQRAAHLSHQSSCRRIYHSWREESKRNKAEILCIIHDKMDTAKTAIPRMRVTTKYTASLGQLPINVTGMVTHGHGDGAYAHYSTDCWPANLNYTISSITRLLRRLEGQPIRENRGLFPYPPANSLFEAMLRGKSRCLDVLPPVSEDPPIAPIPLPTNLFLQLDNSAKDNKNQFLMAFLSLLTHRGVFKEIQVGFLLVGHTHEDIDAYFSHLSKTLKSKNTFVLADLMKSFMESQEMRFMPEFIQEVADFKSYISGYLCDGATRLIGLGEMHLFKFYVDSDGWPVMKYKESATDEHWCPRNKPPLRLWKEDGNGRPLLPTGDPLPVPFKRVWGDKVALPVGNQDKAQEKVKKVLEKRSFIKTGLQKYIEFWEHGMTKCEGFAKQFGPYVDYWKVLLGELDKPLPTTPSRLMEGFWPSTHNLGNVPVLQLVGTEGDTTPEDEVLEPYCGPYNERPKHAFNPWRDVKEGSWVLLRPSDPDVYPVWLGRALTAVCRDVADPNFENFLLQFWEPMNCARTPAAKYKDCWSATWVPERSAPRWERYSSVLFASWSKLKSPATRKIPKVDRIAALANLVEANKQDP